MRSLTKMRIYSWKSSNTSPIGRFPSQREVAGGGKAINDDAVTIIAAGGIGFIKELYEPLFEELLLRAESAGFSIRAIWMADPVNTGASAVRNQANLGCDPSWWDHSRDLWAMINYLRREMVQPVMGLGHSMGANQL